MPFDPALLDHMTEAEKKELQTLLASLSDYQIFRGKYLRDPAGFVRDCVEWKPGEGLAPYQIETLGMVNERRRASVRGPHGLGKTAMAALAILWFALTRDAGSDDWKIPTTASAWRQLTKFLWPEIHKWSHRLRWDVIGRPAFNERTELLDLNLKLKNGEAFALASDNAALIEGAHAMELLYIFDEAKEIPPEIWDAAEGAFSSGNAYALAISTPGEPNGRFYEIHKRAPGFEDWWCKHVTRDQAIAAGRMSAEWAAARERQWGKESAVYQNRVAGEFASSSEDSVISLASLERSNLRWLAHEDADDWGPLTGVGVDVGRGGDFSVFARRHSRAIKELQRDHSADTMAVAGILEGILEGHPGVKATVDVLGIGAGVVDHARIKYATRVIPFVAGGSTELKDEAGEMGFADCRSAGHWNLRVLLNNDEIDLPPDDKLTGDLTAPRWKPVAGGKIRVESKEDLRDPKRLGRSTDDGDAVMMVFFPEGRSASDEDLEAYAKSQLLSKKSIGPDLLNFLKDSGIDVDKYIKDMKKGA